jgi:uncharacterized membrane protein (DUF4010 family)
LLVASGLAGLADVHASTISVATLAAAGKLSAENSVVPILVAYSANTASKAMMALVSGGKNFARQMIPGLILQLASIWLGWWLF